MNGLLRGAWRVSRYELRHAARSRRVWMTLALMAAIIHLYGSPVRAMCISYGVKVSPLPLFVGLTGTHTPQSLLYMVWIYWVCDAPFIDRTHTYVLLRSGRGRYAAGMAIYLLLSGAVYWLAVWGMSVLLMAGHLALSAEWGQVYTTLARTRTAGVNLTYLTTVQKELTAAQALLLSFWLQVCCSFLLGALVMAGNSLSRWLGVFLAFAVLLFDKMFFWFGLPYSLMHYSPVTLANLNALDYYAASYHPSVQYALCALPAAGVLLGTGSVCLTARRVG